MSTPPRFLVTLYTLILALFFLLLTSLAHAAAPSSGTMSPTTPSATWGGGPFTASTTNPVAADCTNSTCDDYLLTITGTDATIHTVTVRIDWTNPANDLDLHAFDHASGAELAVDGASVGTSETVTFTGAPGVYRISVLVYRAVNESYTAVANLVTSPPETPNVFRTASYQRFDFGFTPEVKLPSQERSLVFVNQDTEPEIEIDRFGTIYVGAIRGVGGGVDFWRSDNGGSSFDYLGQPDGTQSTSPAPGTEPDPEGGVGGGDVDLALGDPFYLVPPVPGVSPGVQSTGRVYLTSLWLGSATLSVSTDRGDNWAPFPFTTAQLDRQWNVARGEKTLYMSLRKLAHAEAGQHDVYVTQSDDGMTFPKASYVQDPITGVVDDVGGNSVLQSDGTLLGTFVSKDRRDLYVWRTPKFPAYGPANLPVGTFDAPVFQPTAFDAALIFHGANGLTTSNRFPIMAVDKGDNIHIVFSDRHNIYLISCPAGANPTLAASWTNPVALNAPGVTGFEFTRTCVLPWVRAGASGKLGVIWYGTDTPGDPDTPAFETNQVPWKVVYAQVENALSDQPSVYLDVASKQGGGVIHKGQICLRGLGCPDGTRELAEYSSLTVDNNGFPNLIYEATVFPGKDEGATSAICFFTKGTQRPLTTSETLTSIDCADPSLTSYGGWHSVDDSRATGGHYCRNVGANKTNSKAYLQFSFTGSQVDLRMASGPRGGNAEVLIDGVSRGKVDFYRAATDPTKPDNSGKKDLTFGEFASFPTTSGAHTFRLNVLNDFGSPRDMIYVDGFVVHSGGGTGAASTTDNTITLTGTAPAGVLGTPGVALQHVSTTSKTQLIDAVFEVADDAHPQLKILDTFGTTLQSLTATLPTGSLRAAPTIVGSYGVAVLNPSSAAMPYTLRLVTTDAGSGGGLAAAAPGKGEADATARFADPVDGQAVLRYTLQQPGSVVMRVFDVSGRMIHEIRQERPAGSYTVAWDGRLADGHRVPSGIYFYRVTTPDGREVTHRTAIVR